MTDKGQALTAKRLVVKVGTTSLTYPDGLLNEASLIKLTSEIAEVRAQGCEVVLVTSGAVGAGRGRLKVPQPRTLSQKQALASVGQGLLMHRYEELFQNYGLPVAQILLTREDLADRRRYLNARHTFASLFRYGALPIVNENDTVAVEEIRLGDNDTLSALVAVLIGADLLIILSDTDGLYTGDPHKDTEARLIPQVREITPELEALAGGSGSSLGTGGMFTKLLAARIAMESGVSMAIARAAREGVLKGLLDGALTEATWFLPAEASLKGKAGWIAFGPLSRGKLSVDQGAVEALVKAGKSLLPIGVTEVEGNFSAGSIVRVVSPGGEEIARGIVNYSAEDIKKIRGHRSMELPNILPGFGSEEVIHRNNLVVRTSRSGKGGN